MSTAVIEREAIQDALPVCLSPWLENPYRLVGLWDMRFEAVKAMKAFQLLAKMEMASVLGHGQVSSPTFYEVSSKISGELAIVLADLGLNRQAARASEIAEFMISNHKSPDESSIKNLSLLVHHDLESYAFEAIPTDRAVYYTDPLKGWENTAERFGCGWDIEEAGKCFALGRFTASVFHLMRLVERAVLELGCFLAKPDPRAHFGSVLNKLEDLNQKTEFKDLPDHLKPHREFLIAILPQLHAVKDAWRNKVSHVDWKITPTGTFTEEMASGVYDATLLLMKKLSAGLPAANIMP